MNRIIFCFILTIVLFAVSPRGVLAEEKVAGHSGTLALIVSEENDVRVKKLEQVLKKHNSPLSSYAVNFVETADKYQLADKWSLVAAIAGVESTFGKFTPNNSYNAWGWGIPTGARSGIGFTDWTDGIELVTKGLKERYIARGADTIEKIGRIYAPPSTTWARNVRFFMNQIESATLEPELSI